VNSSAGSRFDRLTVQRAHCLESPMPGRPAAAPDLSVPPACLSFAPCFTMQVHYNIHDLPVFNKAVLTIGTFDGVHLGHREILAQLKAAATAIHGETVLVSFHPHPRQVIGGGKPIALLNTLAEKTVLLEKEGIDHLVMVPFTEAFSNQSPELYAEDFLVKYFHPHTLIIGYDHHFGKERKGNYQLLEAYAAKGVFQLKEIAPQLISNTAVSSTRIRTALQAGDVATARQLLGYDYAFTATVVKGNQLGRTIGFATANLDTAAMDKLVPGNGVYVTSVQLGGRRFRGMMNIGNRPTVNGFGTVTEVHILDFDEDIYGQPLTVTLLHRLRNEQKFPSLAALKEQLAKDKEATAAYLP
jgi:riboflavin kinase / FMN adenylyltransferase